MITRSRSRVERESTPKRTKHSRILRMRKVGHREHIQYHRGDMGRRGGTSGRGVSSRRKPVQTSEVAPIRLFSMTEEENREDEILGSGYQRRVLLQSNSSSVGNSANSGSREQPDVEGEDMENETASPSANLAREEIESLTQDPYNMDIVAEASHSGSQPFIGDDRVVMSTEEIADEDDVSMNDEEPFGCDEDEIRGRQKLNSVATISSLRMKPSRSSRFTIPLCRLVAMPVVRPTLQSDLSKLEQEFVHGYREGAAVFYVSITNEDGKTQEVTAADKEAWGPLWDSENESFENYLASVPELASLTNLMFFVCDGNHRRQAWLNHIERLHRDDASWHYWVDAIVLDTKDRIGVVMQVMHDINKQTEDSHVKTNTVHILFRVRKYALMTLDKFSEVLSPAQLRKCERVQKKTWYSLPLNVFTSFIFQHEISIAADDGVRQYIEQADGEVTAAEKAAAMKSAVQKKIEKLRIKMGKLVCVANPDLTDGWLQEIERHYTLNALSPELMLEKLQLIATSKASPSWKIKWLEYFNSSAATREARRLPPKLINEERLAQFLAKACWWAGITEQACNLFDEIMRQDRIRIDMTVPQEPMSLSAYIEDCRMKLWEHAFSSYFRGHECFKKSDDFVGFKGTDLLVCRVLFRYFKYELLPKKAIAKDDLPIFLTTWLDRSNEACMFSAAQQRTWTTAHLTSRAWYLDCGLGYTPPQEIELKKTRQALLESEEQMFDLNAIEDESARDKALRRRLDSDRKKAQKVKDAEEKADQKEKDRLERAAEKAAKKGKKKVSTPGALDATVQVPAGSTVQSGSHARSGSTRGTKRDLSYEQLTEVPILPATDDEGIEVGEFILNSSLDDVLGGQSGVLPASYNDLKLFLSSHSKDRDRLYKGRASSQACVDLILVDMPEGLPVPGISDPATSVPDWNQCSKEWLEPVLDFADQHLQDDGAIIIFHPFRLSTKANILGYCKSYGFEIRKEWWGMNRLHLASPMNPLFTTMRFGICLAVRSLPGVPKSKFAFHPIPALDRVGVDVSRDDILQNYVSRDDQLMNGSTAWRGPREKSVLLLQMLIEASTQPGDVVLDCTAATGPSIHACRNVHRHIAALEADKAIFEALLAPLKRTASAPVEEEASITILDDIDGEEVVIEKIVKKSRFNAMP